MFLIDILNEIVTLFLEMAPYLLIGLLFVGVLHIWFTKDMVARYIGKRNMWSVIKASLFGVPLPLCSCGVIPTGVYMNNSGASKPSTVSFLISTPQTGFDSIIATYGMMGWVFAIFRPIAAFIMGISGGAVTLLFNKEKAEPLVDNQFNVQQTDLSGEACDDDDCGDSCSADKSGSEIKSLSFWGKIKEMNRYAFKEFLDDIAIHFVWGIILAGLIAFFIPEDFFAGTVVEGGIFGMILMVIVGIPMYICATGSIPIAVAFMMKGLTPGMAFVFLAAGPATNAATLAVLGKTLGKKVTALYVGSIAVFSILMGLILDELFNIFQWDYMSMFSHMGSHDVFFTPESKIVLGVIFAVLLAMSLYRKYIKGKLVKTDKTKEKAMDNKKTFNVEGMSCNHCVENVRKAVEKVQGVEKVEVDLNAKKADVEGDFKDEDIKNAIEQVGYQVTG